MTLTRRAWPFRLASLLYDSMKRLVAAAGGFEEIRLTRMMWSARSRRRRKRARLALRLFFFLF